MKNLLLLLILLPLLLMVGCGGTALTPEMLGAMGFKENVAVVADNFTVRELGLYHTQQVRLQEYAKMHAASGVNVDFEVREIEGVVYILPQIAYRERPEVVPVSMQSAGHPLWAFATNAAKYGLIGYGIREFAGVLEAGYDAAQGATYNGPVMNSGNTVGQDFNSGGEYILDSNSRNLFESQNAF